MQNNIHRLFDIILYQSIHRPDKKVFRYKHKGVWEGKTVREFVEMGNELSMGLVSQGVKKGDHIAIIAGNSWKWHLIDFAISQIGAISVPLYPTLKGAEYQLILEECEASLLFVGNDHIYDTLKDQHIITQKKLNVFGIDEVEGIQNYTSLLAVKDEALLDALRSKVLPSDLATIIYTSGTEGNPKGVMLTHNNILSNIKTTSKAFPLLTEHAVALTFLPLNHVYEKMVTYVYMYIGCEINYAESLATIIDDAKAVKPTVFTGVPLIMKKLYDKILQKGGELKGWKKHIFFWAVALTHQWTKESKGSLFFRIQRAIADRLIYNKWREVLGGRILLIPSGSAALHPSVCRFFQCAGINLVEGYGLTETSPIIAVNRMEKENFKIGTVGPIMEGVRVKIAEDGEILVKGDNVMIGYYKKPEETAKALQDGWFHTGDIGELVENKFLKIVDRKKEIFKTSGGKYVSPQLIELKIKESHFVEHAMIVGSNEPVVGAIIQPLWEQLYEFAKSKGIAITDNAQLIQEKEILSLYAKIIDHVNTQLASHEQVRKFELIADAWSSTSGELTPNLKIKRRIIMERYNNLYEKMYGRM